MERYRVVSVFIPKVGAGVLCWKVQELVDEGEARWADCVFPGVNMFNTAGDAVRKMRNLVQTREEKE